MHRTLLLLIFLLLISITSSYASEPFNEYSDETIHFKYPNGFIFKEKKPSSIDFTPENKNVGLLLVYIEPTKGKSLDDLFIESHKLRPTESYYLNSSKIYLKDHPAILSECRYDIDTAVLAVYILQIVHHDQHYVFMLINGLSSKDQLDSDIQLLINTLTFTE